jgi:hypothetical protein
LKPIAGRLTKIPLSATNRRNARESGMASSAREFDRKLLACIQELTVILEGLGARYSSVVLAGALAAHLGRWLRHLVLRGVCSPESAREMLKDVERAAFAVNPAVKPGKLLRL